MVAETSLDVAPPSLDWEQTARRLREPFDPNEVDFRVQGRANDQTGRAQVVAYIDARAVQDRLDAVVGAGNWSFDWTPLVIDNGEVMVAKGTLSLFGVSKSDAGSASNFEQTLGAVSHCLKRAAVHWGIGRYLYNLPATWVAVERGGRIPENILRDLRARLPRPDGVEVKAEVVSEQSDDLPAERRRPTAVGRSTTAAPSARAAAGDAPRTTTSSVVSATAPVPTPAAASEQPATEQQLSSIRKLCAALARPEVTEPLTLQQARTVITQLSADYQRARRAS